MTTGVALAPPIWPWFFNNGQLAAGGSILTQVGGVNTATYQDFGLTTPLPNPIPLNSRGEISNAAGTSCQCFLTPNIVYTFIFYDAGGNQIWQATYVNGVQIALTQAAIGLALYPQTAAEIAAGVTPVNYAYAPYNVKRYGALGNGSANDGPAIQIALSLCGPGLTTIYFPPGNYLVTSASASTPNVSLTIPGIQITLRGEGAFASKITNGIVGNPANSLFTWTAGGSNAAWLLVEGLYFQGNNISGAGGNGNTFSLIGVLGTAFANTATFRDCFFANLLGNGLSGLGASIAGAAIYMYFANVVKVINCFFETCNVGLCIDGNLTNQTEKVHVSDTTFENTVNYAINALFVTNLLVNDQTIFNNTGNSPILLNSVQESCTIDSCRFKVFTAGGAIVCVSTQNVDQLNITNNFFFNTFQSSPFPCLDLGSNIEGLNIVGNEFLFDSTVTNGGQAIVLQDPSGFIGASYNITGNRFLASNSCVISSFILLNNGTDGFDSLFIQGNYFGQQSAGGYTVTNAIALTGAAGGSSTTVANNTFATATATITNAINIGAGWTGTLVLNNTYIGTITNKVVNNGTKTLRIEAGSQTLLQSIDTLATTGSKTATFSASNKPGTNNVTAPANWLPVVCDGATYYIPLFSV
jgi:Pectate lyase superfamily protein